MKRRSLVSHLSVACLVSATLVFLSGSPAWADSCAFDPATSTVAVAVSGTESGQGQNQLSVAGGQIMWEGVPCGGATVNNTDTVNVIGTDGDDDFLVNLAGGQLAPGVTPEPDGAPEIEVNVDLRGQFDLAGLQGTSQGDTLRLVPTGFDVNLDLDVDVFLVSTELFLMTGNGGNDRLSAKGVRRIILLVGHGGNDRLVGGSGADITAGGGGNDVLLSGPGEDFLFGDSGNDFLSGGPGGDRLKGGPGRDRCRGGPGKNVLKQCE